VGLPHSSGRPVLIANLNTSYIQAVYKVSSTVRNYRPVVSELV